MRIAFSILFLFVIKLSGFSQPTEFFRTFDLGSNSSPVLGNLIEINNKIFLNGTISSPNQKILTIKTNSQGLLEDTNIIGTDTLNYYPGNFLQASDNSLLILGNNVMGPVTRQYMLFIDTNLTKISDSTYTNIIRTFWGNIKINQSFYFAGNTKYNNNGDSLSYYNMLFWKTDNNFNQIISNSIGIENKHETCNTIKAGFDNNLLLGGITIAIGNQEDWYLVNVDTNGQVLNEYYYGNSTHTDANGIKSISLGSDSTYLLAGLYYQFDFGPGQYYYAATVVKINRQFQTLWTKKIGSSLKGISVSNLTKTSDGNQVILTQRTPLNTNLTKYSQLTKFNNNGEILWSRNYYQGDTNTYIRYRAWDLIETSEKGFAMCGSALDTANIGPYQVAWLVKTDSLGCDGLRSCNDTALVCEILQAPDTACKNDTAWIHVKFKGRSAPYFVYANNTIALDSVYYPYTLPLWIDTLVPYYPITTGLQQVIIKVNDSWGWYQTDTVQVFVKNCGAGNIEEAWYPKKVEVFPNPATSEIHVKIRTAITIPVTITIYDMQGKVVKQITTKLNETVIDVSGLGQGVYGVRVIGNNVNASERFVKIE